MTDVVKSILVNLKLVTKQ